MKEIESAAILELQDSSSSELLAELNDKHKRSQLFPVITFIAVIVLIILLLMKLQVWVYVVTIPIAAISIFWARQNDQLTKTVVLFYELDGVAESAYQALHDAFKELISCSCAWHIEASGEVKDIHAWKKHSGASTLVRRKPIAIKYEAPHFVSTNLSVPKIPAGLQSLYFFPDRILVYEAGKVGAISYSDIRFEHINQRFIEDDRIPSDAMVVDHTWKYLNKNGRPDKRFKDNRQLPIALYSDLRFKSSTGLNKLIEVSRPDMGISLQEALVKLSDAQIICTR